MTNVYTEFKKLLNPAPLLVGDITEVNGGIATIELPDGTLTTGRGDGLVSGQRVFVRAGMVEGTAPALPVVLVEI